MNLHGIVRGAISAVNPNIEIPLKRASGYTTQPSGKQVPTYDAPVVGPAQVQPMSKGDLRHMNDLNITGVFRKVYLYGFWMGAIRADKTGGDILSFPQIPGRNLPPKPFLAPPQVGGSVAFLAPALTSAPNAQEWKIVDVLETWPDWCCVAVVLQ